MAKTTIGLFLIIIHMPDIATETIEATKRIELLLLLKCS